MKHRIILVLVGILAMAYAEPILTKPQVSRMNGWWDWCHDSVIAAGGSITYQDGAGVAKSPALEPQSRWKIQLVRQISLEADKRYALKFELQATKAGRLEIVYSSSGGTNYYSTNFDVQAGQRVYECVIEPKRSKGEYGEPRNINFWLGGFKDATITLSDVSIETAQ